MFGFFNFYLKTNKMSAMKIQKYNDSLGLKEDIILGEFLLKFITESSLLTAIFCNSEVTIQAIISKKEVKLCRDFENNEVIDLFTHLKDSVDKNE
jgi:hypothetical protein